MQATPAVIVGAGGHAVSVAETVRSAGFQLVAFVSVDAVGGTLLGCPILPEVPGDHAGKGGVIVLAIGDNAVRQRIWNQLRREFSSSAFPAIRHASATVAEDTRLSQGAVIMQGAAIGNRATIGAGVLINTGAILDHESEMKEFSSLAPRAVTGGRVQIGERSAVSIGAVVRHGIRVGRDTVVGAASYVHRDLPDEVVAYGVPARVIRSRIQGDPYLV